MEGFFNPPKIVPGIGRVCGNRNLELGGYCLGSVDSQDQLACDQIFSVGSGPLIVNSADQQNELWDNRNTLQIQSQHRYGSNPTQVMPV